MGIVTVRQPNGAEEERRSVSGGWKAILEVTGIDIREFPNVMNGSDTAQVLKDGHQWSIEPWECGGGFAVASRKLTEEEAERSRVQMLRRSYVNHFTKDRWLMCLDVADQIRHLTAKMRPDHPPARSVRRAMKQHINRLTKAQWS